MDEVSSRAARRQEIIEAQRRKRELLRERIEARMRERAKQPLNKIKRPHSTRPCCGG